MCHHALKWTGFSSSAHMQSQKPLHWPISGSTWGPCCPLPLQGYPGQLASLHSHALPPCAFPSSLQGSPGSNSCPCCLFLLPFSTLLLLLTVFCLCFFAGPPAHQVYLSHICSASWAKFDGGLQHNTWRIHQCKQQMFQSFCN